MNPDNEIMVARVLLKIIFFSAQNNRKSELRYFNHLLRQLYLDRFLILQSFFERNTKFRSFCFLNVKKIKSKQFSNFL